MNVVVNPKPEDQAAGQQNSKQSVEGNSAAYRKITPGRQCDREGNKKKGEKNRSPTESRQGTAVQVALQSRVGHPSVCGREIAHVPGENKRKQQRPCKSREVKKCQLTPLSK